MVLMSAGRRSGDHNSCQMSSIQRLNQNFPGNIQERSAHEVTHGDIVQIQETELLMLASNWNQEAADNLHKKDDLVHKKDIHGRTPLHMAALFNCKEMVKWLVGRGVDLEEKTYLELQTPTHYAARYGSIPTLKLLLASGSSLEPRDYNGRTPLHLAIQLDRALVVEYLVSLPQPADVLTMDNLGNIAISSMIISTPSVAYKALDKYHTVRTTERKDCFSLIQLEPDVYEECTTSNTPFEAAVEERRAYVLLHPVMKAMHEVMWKFIQPYFFIHLITYFVFTVVWSFDFSYEAVQDMHISNYPQDLWRVFLSGIITIIYSIEVIFEVVMMVNSIKHHKTYRRGRKGAIQSDINTLVYTDEEFQFLRKKKSKLRLLPRYFRDPWTYLSWLSKILILFSVASRIYVPITNQVGRNTDLSRHGCFATIVIWILLLKFVRASSRFAPLLSILFRIRIFHFLLIGLIFYIPYVLSFWVMFGGGVAHNITDADTTMLDSIPSISVMVFRMALIDDYPYEIMKQIDPLMTLLLVVSFLLIMAIIGVNVFIALLSNIVEHVYEDTLASAALQQASLLYSYSQLFFCCSTKRIYLKYIKKHCNPYIKEYNERRAMKKAESKVSMVKMSEMIEEIIQRGDRCNEELKILRGEIKEMKNALCKASNRKAGSVEEQTMV